MALLHWNTSRVLPYLANKTKHKQSRGWGGLYNMFVSIAEINVMHGTLVCGFYSKSLDLFTQTRVDVFRNGLTSVF